MSVIALILGLLLGTYIVLTIAGRLRYLAVRVPLQINLMAWAWWFAVRRVRPPASGRP